MGRVGLEEVLPGYLGEDPGESRSVLAMPGVRRKLVTLSHQDWWEGVQKRKE